MTFESLSLSGVELEDLVGGQAVCRYSQPFNVGGDQFIALLPLKVRLELAVATLANCAPASNCQSSSSSILRNSY